MTSPIPTDDDGPLPKSYDATAAEARWYALWEDAGIFKADAAAVAGGKKPYVIMMPPPNVTGTLHMGHALFVTLQDILARMHRMQGDETLWLPGVDHAGIATQTVVERELKRHENKSRHDVGRENFLARVWAWKDKSGSRIVEQLKALGASADWSRERFTMDETCNRAVKEAFVRMYSDGLIYRGERLVNWDPITLTGLSDEEVEHEEKDGELWRFAYKLKSGAVGAKTFTSPHDAEKLATVMLPADDAEEIVVATTRPETMLGDVAVAVHPDDARYTAWHGKELAHPFFPERKVVVIADAMVDRAFGTGAVKLTPAHDAADFDTGQRHNLPAINIFTLDAKVNDNGGIFEGLDRFVARKQVKAALEAIGLFRGVESIKHNVTVSQRSGAVIEPLLSRQYFVRTKTLATMALDVVKNGELKIVPEWWTKTWDHFMLNNRDWNISRQLWWGHRIPMFYDLTKLDEAIEADANAKGRDTAAVKAQADGVRGKDLLKVALATLDDKYVEKFSIASTVDLATQDAQRYVQDDDVLDTWFSSGLWPFSTLGWPDKTADLAAFYPGAVLETGSDILFFWVARMVWMGCYFMKRVPFSEVFLHAMVRDGQGKKMSKSQGNALDPLDVMAGIALEALLEKTKSYPVPEKKLPGVLKALQKEFPEGIPAAGADGLRFTLAALSSQGRDVKLSIPRAAGYKAFLNKIYNAARFALMKLGPAPIPAFHEVKADLTLADRWIVSRLQRAAHKVTDHINNYRFDEATNAHYQFFWTELCDVYIEASKLAIDRPSTRATLVHVLDASLRLLHPMCPFLSEEIWQQLPGRFARWPLVKFCAVAPWPTSEAAWIDEAAEKDMAVVSSAVTMARNVRQESGLGPRAPVHVDLVSDDPHTRAALATHGELIKHLAVLSGMKAHARAGYAAPTLSGMQSSGSLEVVVHLEGLIDIEKERARLFREIDKANKDKEGIERRFESADFVAKAPPEVVAEGRANIAALGDKIERLRAARARLV